MSYGANTKTTYGKLCYTVMQRVVMFYEGELSEPD